MDMRNIQQCIDAVSLNKPYLVHIKNDAHDISNRIKDIDDGYFIMYNTLTNDFEVHHVDNGGSSGTFSLILPYDELDSRTLEYVRKRERSNTEALLKELNAENEKIDKEKMKDAHNKFEEASYELASDLRRAL